MGASSRRYSISEQIIVKTFSNDKNKVNKLKYLNDTR